MSIIPRWYKRVWRMLFHIYIGVIDLIGFSGEVIVISEFLRYYSVCT